MKGTCIYLTGVLAAILLVGCTTPLPPGAEPGPRGTMAYSILVEASEPGARIEADGDYIGETPVQLKIFGDRDGTFHDFGSSVFTVRAFPVTTNQYPQTRIFHTGRMFGREDKIPGRIYFDMNQPAPAYVPVPVPVYVSPPPPPMYYGPSFYYGRPSYYGPRYYPRHGSGLYRDPRFSPHVTPPLKDRLFHHRRR
ncbi:MAG: hypothetical protein H0X66_09370 [Verrucomicrobia bacterium]|nr:hypothetical protein [Verrucomicrobiota bacterium]